MSLFRTSVSIGLALVLADIAGAAQYQIGGTSGLSTSYITSGCLTSTCIAGFSEQNYDTTLFSGAVNGSTAPVPFSGYSTTASTPLGSTLTDTTNGVTFSMISDGLTSAGASKNVWTATSLPIPNPSAPPPTAPTLTIPIGIFGVGVVWTMINSEMHAAGPARDTTILFDFSSSPTGATGVTTVRVKLTSTGSDSSPVIGTQIQDAVDCPLVAACANLANAPAASVTVGPTFNSANSLLIPAGLTVFTNQLYSSPYTNATGSYANTSGTIVLDDQGFNFGAAFSQSWLVDIRVQEVATDGGVSALGISAVTVQTPEPSTVLLALMGLGAIGIRRLRRRP